MNIATSLKAGLVVLASVSGTIVVSDLVLRSVGYLPQVDNEWLLGRGEDSRVPDDQLILVRPQMLTENYYNVDPTLKTIVALGDSFVEGHPVKRSDSYPTILGRLLGERGRPVNVLNMGIGDSGPDQHLRLMKAYVLPRLTPDIVIWSFYANDVFDNLQQAVYSIENNSLVPLDATKHWLYIRHRIYRSIPLPGTVKESSPVLRLLFRALEIWGKRDFLLEEPSGIAWSREKIHLAIEEMERLAQAHGFRVAYVLIAPQSLYLREQDPTQWSQDFHVAGHEELRRILEDQGLFIDAWFGGPETHVCGSKVSAPAWHSLFADDGRDRNRPGRRHFNEAGYYLLGDIMATCLLSGTV
ncbi:MAG: GDSL-type esterase/lipase family protein [Pseudomonadota bacterium]|nr:GDSL-type esterase/lipase family protein [Pseudomonadota bacterium]